MNDTSSSAGKRVARTGRPGRKAARPGAPCTAGEPRDADALDALAWMERGMPDEEIVYDEDAPRLTKEQLAEFRPARFVFPRRGK